MQDQKMSFEEQIMKIYSEEGEIPRRGVEQKTMEESNIEMSNHCYCYTTLIYLKCSVYNKLEKY
jgi:hypothetical protein